MQFNKTMVDLFFEIRRELPSEQRSLKISDPELGDKFIRIYKQSNDETLRQLIAVFLEFAGENWLRQLERQTNNHYRGIKKSVKRPKTPSKNASPKKSKAVSKSPRIYRGNIIEE